MDVTEADPGRSATSPAGRHGFADPTVRGFPPRKRRNGPSQPMPAGPLGRPLATGSAGPGMPYASSVRMGNCPPRWRGPPECLGLHRARGRARHEPRRARVLPPSLPVRGRARTRRRKSTGRPPTRRPSASANPPAGGASRAPPRSRRRRPQWSGPLPAGAHGGRGAHAVLRPEAERRRHCGRLGIARPEVRLDAALQAQVASPPPARPAAPHRAPMPRGQRRPAGDRGARAHHRSVGPSFAAGEDAERSRPHPRPPSIGGAPAVHRAGPPRRPVGTDWASAAGRHVGASR